MYLSKSTPKELIIKYLQSVLCKTVNPIKILHNELTFNLSYIYIYIYIYYIQYCKKMPIVYNQEVEAQRPDLLK